MLQSEAIIYFGESSLFFHVVEGSLITCTKLQCDLRNVLSNSELYKIMANPD
jgi:hypothetical protein